MEQPLRAKKRGLETGQMPASDVRALIREFTYFSLRVDVNNACKSRMFL
jgi:hypothetical protein